jgi:SsrA-binding protein
VEGADVWLYNVNTNPYSHRGYVDHDPKRSRKLLLHKQEIRKLIGKTVEKGLTLVPTRLYFKNGKVKVALALAKGKQMHDKRESSMSNSPSASGAEHSRSTSIQMQATGFRCSAAR